MSVNIYTAAGLKKVAGSGFMDAELNENSNNGVKNKVVTEALNQAGTVRYNETTDYIQVKKNGTWYNYKYFNPSAPYALIPTMTSNTTPEGIASGTVDSSNAYKVFDGDDITTWGVANSSATDTVSYEFASPVKCSSYRLVISPLYNVNDHTVNIDVQTLDSVWTNVVTLTVPHVTTSGDTRTYTGDIDFNESIKAIRISDNGGYFTPSKAYYHFINSLQLYGYIA